MPASPHTQTPPALRDPRSAATRVTVQDIALPDAAGTLALITLDGGADRPATLGPAALVDLAEAMDQLGRRASELAAIAVTGRSRAFVAGADLAQTADITTPEAARDIARAGHAAFRTIADAPVPTFALVNGLALGGGLELALHCDYRAAARNARLGLPEVSLGLVPGWGGSYLLPRLVGLDAAIEVICTRGLSGTHLTAPEAMDIGLVDAALEPDGFLDRGLDWIASVLLGRVGTTRDGGSAAGTGELSSAARTPEAAHAVVTVARERMDDVVHGSRQAPYRALEVLEVTATATRAEAHAVEDETLAELIVSDEARACMYSFSLISAAKRRMRGVRAVPLTRVGVVGAGLMAAQIAALVAVRAGVPVVMRDLDETRVASGLAHVRADVERQVARGRLTAEAAAWVTAQVSGTTQLADFAGCDLVIEAITEDLALKKRVFAELETVVDSRTVLATNTSALSVTDMAAMLEHPERVIGLHFFNPVSAMPLVEVVRAAHSSAAALSLGQAVCASLGKTAVITGDRPGFIVNRLLVLLLGIVASAIDDGMPPDVADHALDPLGLPMGPLALLDLVGPGVGLHVLQSLRADLGDRFPRSTGLERLVAQGAPASTLGVDLWVGPSIPDQDAADLLDRVLTALTKEIGLMLDEGVVDEPSDIDLSLLLGAGWPNHLGGITAYLDRTGYSQRVLGHRLLPDRVASLP